MFAEHAKRTYGVDMTGLDEAYDSECVEFFSLSSLWRELAGHQVISGPTVVKGVCFASLVGVCRCQRMECVCGTSMVGICRCRPMESVLGSFS